MGAWEVDAAGCGPGRVGGFVGCCWEGVGVSSGDAGFGWCWGGMLSYSILGLLRWRGLGLLLCRRVGLLLLGAMGWIIAFWYL